MIGGRDFQQKFINSNKIITLEQADQLQVLDEFARGIWRSLKKRGFADSSASVCFSFPGQVLC